MRKAIKNKRTSYYAAPVQEIFYLQEGKRIQIGLLVDGNIQNRPVKVENQTILLSNTCPFDAIVQCFGSAYYDSKIYKNIITERFISSIYL